MVKLIQIILLLFVITSCAQIKNKNILLGKWQLIATNENDGGKPHTNEVKNGEILNFQDRNLLNNEKGEKGTYQLENDHLKIVLSGNTRQYLLWYDDKKNTVLHLTPVTEHYQLICDEGCSFTYVKKKEVLFC